MRKPIIAGNWKMHYTIEEANNVITELIPLVKDAKSDVVICAPFIQLPEIVKLTKGTNIKVGAQNMHFEEKGAFTGEISPVMLKSLGIDYVIIGHSERRQYFNETDETVNKKLHSAYSHDLLPILCVGESLEEREGNKTEEVLKNQVTKDLEGLTNEQVEKLVIAYEPIWAIGTGKTASDEQANDTIKFIRKIAGEMFGDETAQKLRIQYGGSVKPQTIKGQMEMSDIDGALVGGASLIASDFSKIVNF